MSRALRPVPRSVEGLVSRLLERMHDTAEKLERHDPDLADLVLRHREALEEEWRAAFYVDEREAA